MLKLLVWCVLLVVCWPLALVALVLYPVVWLLLLPFRVIGIAVEGVLSILWAVLTLPARLLGTSPRRRDRYLATRHVYTVRDSRYSV